MTFTVLDLFSAAAGGWSLGLHRAGFRTVAACEWIDWRRALYAENNPGVPIYDDVRTLTADRLRADLGAFPDVVVGSPPCQDISSANAKGKGVDGERSGLYFEAIRIIGEGRPRWFALENSANLRSRGADRVLGALEAHGYACWAVVVSAEDLGANHERKRSWLIGSDLDQLADAPQVGCASWAGNSQGGDAGVDGGEPDRGAGDGAATSHADEDGWHAERCGRGGGLDVRVSPDPRHADQEQQSQVIQLRPRSHADGARGVDGDAAQDGRGPGLQRRRAGAADGAGEPPCGDDRPVDRSMGLCAGDRGDAAWGGADWSLALLADHLRLDDGLSARVAGQRLAGGTPKGTAAASLIVEAFGDAVIPQIPEVIGRAILRVEAAYAIVTGRAA